MSEQKYQYNGNICTWLPGVGALRPGQIFTSRYPIANPDFAKVSDGEATKPGELTAADRVCAKCVRVKNIDKKAKKKE